MAMTISNSIKLNPWRFESGDVMHMRILTTEAEQCHEAEIIAAKGTANQGIFGYPSLYLRIVVSTSCAHASMPPRSTRTFCKPCPMKYAAASSAVLP